MNPYPKISCFVCMSVSGVSIIADVAESIAETQPISINRIEIWERLIGKIQTITVNVRVYKDRTVIDTNTLQCTLTKMAAPSASQTTRKTSEKYFPGTKSKSGDMKILRILQISSQSADGTKLKLCQEPFANSAGERTPIKAYQLYALLSLVRSLGKRYTRYHQNQWDLYKLQREEGRDLTQSC